MKQYDKIYAYVIDRGYHSMSNFCREFGLSPTIFSDLKGGKTKSLSIKNLQLVAEALGVSVDALAAKDEDEDGVTSFSYSDFVALCDKKNLTQTQIAKLSGVSSTIIYRWKHSINEPTFPTKKKLIEALDAIPDVEPNFVEYLPHPVPIYGKIHAGKTTIAQQDIIGYGYTDKPNPTEYFFLVVDGDSMEPTIADKTKVLVKRQSTADDGEIVACIVNGEEATIKRIKYYGADKIFLLPDNNKYEPIQLQASDFESGQSIILGVVKQCIKDF